MTRILLSQSQVSVAISSSVVVIFTLLLFLSGYIIQQRTVTGLQAAIKPRLPQRPPSLSVRRTSGDSNISPSRLFRGNGRVAYTRKADDVEGSVDWKRLAHVQIARNHHEVCSAIMVLAELHRMKSPAAKILMFPVAWAEEMKYGKGPISDPFTDSSRRLMRMAARRYGVELRPVTPIVEHSAADDESRDIYSIASAFALTEYDRLLSIETPGLLLDASPLDAVLAYTENAPFGMLQDTTKGDGVHSDDLLLFQPSSAMHTQLLSRLAAAPNYSDSLLPTFFTDPLLVASSSKLSTLIQSIGSLHDATADFNATAYLSDLAYIRFSDSKLPGPEYDLPWSTKVEARPKNKDADWVWTKLYGQFAMKRMEICGLDLETWRG